MREINSTVELVKFFDAYKGQTRAMIVTKTPVKMNKKDVATRQIENPHGDVFKIQTVEVELNADYEQKVNDQRLLENVTQDFVATSRNWGKRVNGAIVENHGQLYLHAIEVGRVGKAKYETRTGREVNYADLLPFIPAYAGTKSQGVKDEIKVRDYKMTNVIGLNIGDKVRFLNV